MCVLKLLFIVNNLLEKIFGRLKWNNCFKNVIGSVIYVW